MDLSRLPDLPNHINGNHVHIYRWLDGCGWSIKCDNIYIEDSFLEQAIMKFRKVTEHLKVVYEHKGYGLVGEIDGFNNVEEKSYFY